MSPPHTEKAAHLIASLFTIILASAFTAQSLRAGVSNLQDDQVIGIWEQQEKIPDGGLLRVTIEVDEGYTFKGYALFQGYRVWDFAGNWHLNRDEIVWTYTSSSVSLEHNPDVDQVLSVQGNEMSIKNKPTGKTYQLKRIK